MLNRIKYFIISILLLSAFQNCSNDAGLRSRQYITPKPAVVASVIADQDSSDGVGEFGLSEASGGYTIDPQACYLDYITVFEWKNPTVNLMDEKPILGINKIKSISLGRGGFRSTPIYSGWSVEGILESNSDGSTKMSVKFLKGSASPVDSLDCFIMRVNNQSDIEKGLANTLFQNIGVDRNANVLVGFMRYKEQFIACRVGSGQGDTLFSGEVDGTLSVNSNTAFILKRGCYQEKSDSM